MSAVVPVAVRTWAVGQYTVTMTVPKPRRGEIACIAIEWAPTEPARLSARELALYRLGRNEAIAGIAAELGINVAVLDL